MSDGVVVKPFVGRDLGLCSLPDVWAKMQRFTDERLPESADEVWFVQHPKVFTLGLSADPSHLLSPGDIPVVKTDRGGQVTYHGPGQLVVYVMLDLRRLNMGVRSLVEALEGAVIETVSGYGIKAYGRRDAPGVYVQGRKLAAVGLRIRRHCSYHGFAINVDMELEPFKRINPCGFDDLEVTQLSALGAINDLAQVRQDLEPSLRSHLVHKFH